MIGNDQNKAELIVCRDDETIIKHIKKAGVWDRMLQHSKAGSYAVKGQPVRVAWCA